MNSGVVRSILCFVVCCLVQSTQLHASPFPYVNNFDLSSLANSSADITLDAGNGKLNYVAGPGTIVSTASEPITGIGASDFVVSTRFKLNSVAGTGNNITVGFGVLATSSTYASTGGDSLYLVDWGIFGGTPGTLRILAQGDTSGFTAVNSSIGGGTAGNDYELRLTGTYASGTLNMSVAAFDGLGVQIGAAATASDTSPLAGQFFGYRNRTAGTNHMINASFDSFSVVPEPSSVALGLAGVLGCFYFIRRSAR
jgi:hypothetical protein